MTRWIAPALALACLMFVPTIAEAKTCNQLDRSRGVTVKTACALAVKSAADRKAAAQQRRAFRQHQRRSARHLPHRQRVGAGAYVPEYEGRGSIAVFAGVVEYAAASVPRRASRQRAAGTRRAERVARPERPADRVPADRMVSEILPHPPGCPPRLFCGCGAAVKVFGSPIRSLWLAANWFRFPKAEPAPGMVAVRRGHVFVIEEVVSRGRVIAYDANSGGRKTRRHLRSLAGYSVRNPRGHS